MSHFLVAGIALFFLLALAGSFIRHHHLDRVLRDLVGFHVTVRIGSETVWGRFRLFANAIELLFSQPYTNHRGTRLTSFIMFAPTMARVEGIFRYHDELTPENKQRRKLQIARAKHPGAWRRVKRSLRNFMVSFREAISESLGMLASRVKQRSGLALLKNADGKLQELGNEILDVAQNAAYDPVLEHYIFSRVVFELEVPDGDKLEYTGLLEEYSADWVALLDCYQNRDDSISLIDAERLLMQRKMDFEIRLDRVDDGVAMSLTIYNTDEQEITIHQLTGDEEFVHPVGKCLEPGEQVEIEVPVLPERCLSNVDLEALPVSLQLVAPERGGADSVPAEPLPLLPELKLEFQTCREVDIYLPRSKGILRHAA